MADEGLTFHRLRHSAGHMMRELGAPLEIIQKRLGHASIRTTADICGSRPERVDHPVAGKLDQLFREAKAPRQRRNPVVQMWWVQTAAPKTIRTDYGVLRAVFG